jgi:hypothetical protein
MRVQPTRPTTGRAKKRVITAAVTASSLLLCAAIVWFFLYEPPAASERQYSPPPFEKNAVAGVPAPDSRYLYDTWSQPERFSFAAAQSLYRQHDGSLKLYLTNFEDSVAYLLCEIVNTSTQEVMYRSGLIRPGEYVESLQPSIDIKNEATEIQMRVYALSVEDYLSVGEVAFSKTLQPNFS